MVHNQTIKLVIPIKSLKEDSVTNNTDTSMCTFTRDRSTNPAYALNLSLTLILCPSLDLGLTLALTLTSDNTNPFLSSNACP